MKNNQISGFPALLILAFLFASGCSGTGFAGTTPPSPAPETVTIAPAATPVDTLTPQIVYETASVPPTAVPAPETITIAPATTPVERPTPQIVYEAVFVAPTTVPATVWTTSDSRYDGSDDNSLNLMPAVSADGVTGTLSVRVTGCSADDLSVFIARAGPDVLPVDDRYLLDRMGGGEQNTHFLPVKILPDGSSEPVRLAPGTYTAYLPNKSGDEIEERQSFMIGAHVMTYLSFTGASYVTASPFHSSCSR